MLVGVGVGAVGGGGTAGGAGHVGVKDWGLVEKGWFIYKVRELIIGWLAVSLFVILLYRHSNVSLLYFINNFYIYPSYSSNLIFKLYLLYLLYKENHPQKIIIFNSINPLYFSLY